MGSKDLSTLTQDVNSLFDPLVDVEASEELLNEFCERLKQVIRTRLKKQERTGDRAVRFSSLGKPDRQVWMDAHPDTEAEEQLRAETYLKFLYGDVIEQLYIYLAQEAGFRVENLQKQVEVGGVTGSIDCTIEDVVVDLKSASSYGYQKFKDGTVEQDDPFGYVAQLSGYADVLTPGKEAAWWAVDKTSGAHCISWLKPTVIKHHKPEPRIEHLKKVVESDTPPPLCYDPVPDGKSGNMKLPTPCSYCRHKFRCHPDVRLFLYSNGPRYLTTVVREPDVPEVFREV